MVNARKRKNFIHTLQTTSGTATTQQAKQEVVYRHFLQHTGTYAQRRMLNFNALGWEPKQLGHLDLPFSDEEIKRVIMEAPKEKAPDPDGFIGSFFSECWNIIKEDLFRAVQQFYILNQQELHLLNQAFVVLVPKTSNPQKIGDYRPISLTHSFVKIMSKLLANRLAPQLDQLISVNQIAFIKKCVFMIILSMCSKWSRNCIRKRFLLCSSNLIFLRYLIRSTDPTY
jgi:uncharacterized protein YceK